MEKIYVYHGKNKDFKKLLNLSYVMPGLSYLGVESDFCGMKLSAKLERRLKLFKFDNKRPRRIVYLHKIISSCSILTPDDYSKLWRKVYENKNRWYADGKYKKMPKAITKDNREDYNRKSGYQSGRGKLFCTNCRFTHKSFNYPMFSNTKTKRLYIYKDVTKCTNCGADNSIIGLDSSVRIPRKKANEKIWKNFYKLFVEPRKKTH